MNVNEDSSELAFIATQIANICSAIEYIKKGQPDTSIERLERALDGCVMRLGRMQKKADKLMPIPKETLTTALKVVRTHRRRHPRSAKANESGTVLTNIQETVQKILEGLEN